MALTIEDIAVFCKKKGFVYPNSEIYGGLAGMFDYGHLGVELKNNIKAEWWETHVQQREDIIGIDGSIITNKKVWEASGHATSFTDFILECKKCKNNYRADHLIEDELKIAVDSITNDEINSLIKKHKIICPKCKGELSTAESFNLMFKTHVGPIEKESALAYLRPETAQLIFTNFKLVAENARMKLPFGIAQIGKAFRNEISPRDFLFRSREFEQMEIEYFVHPDKLNECCLKEIENLKLNILTSEMQGKNINKAREMTIKQIINKKLTTKWHAYWVGINYKWFLEMGIKKENLRVREHMKEELAHYASSCFDIDYNFPFGWKELYGNADRKQFDLNQHIKFSKKDLSFYDEETKSKIVPYVASEPSYGVDRAFLAFITDAYNDDKKRGNVVLKLHPKLAPVKVAVFPLVNKLNDESRNIYDMLKKEFSCFYDKSGSVGRRYARQDEVGTPICITVDFQHKEDNTVTLRDRDTTKQIRVKLKDLKETIQKLLKGDVEFEKAGILLK